MQVRGWRGGKTNQGGKRREVEPLFPTVDNPLHNTLSQTPTGAPLYGVCVYTDDLLSRSPSPCRPEGGAPPPLTSRGRSLTARRCYALLTRVPCLDAHVALLREVVGLERVDRVASVVAAADAASSSTPPPPRADGGGGHTTNGVNGTPASPSGANFATPAATLPPPGAPSPLARASARVLAAAAAAPPSTGKPVRELGAAKDRMEAAAAAAAEAAAAPVDAAPSTGDDDDDASFHSASSGERGGVSGSPPPPPTVTSLVAAYGATPAPVRGASTRFAPHPALPTIHIGRAPAASADDEHDSALTWAVAATAAALPLEGVITLLTAALLERPLVVFGGGGAAAAAAVLAVRPLLRPLAWAGPLLPSLPAATVGGAGLALLGSPVPFAAGLSTKTPAAAAAAAGAVRINLYKGAVALPAPLPALPGRAALVAAAAPHHANLVAAAPRPCPLPPPSPTVTDATLALLAAVRAHIEAHVVDGLASASLTEVDTNGDRVTVLLRDAWLATREGKDAPFAGALVETQAFAEYSDAVLGG